MRQMVCMQAALGRNFAGQRYGPRPLDLDIIFYGNQRLSHERLCIPHPRWQERDFVKAPLLDLFSQAERLPDGVLQGLAASLDLVHQDSSMQPGEWVQGLAITPHLCHESCMHVTHRHAIRLCFLLIILRPPHAADPEHAADKGLCLSAVLPSQLPCTRIQMQLGQNPASHMHGALAGTCMRMSRTSRPLGTTAFHLGI